MLVWVHDGKTPLDWHPGEKIFGNIKISDESLPSAVGGHDFCFYLNGDKHLLALKCDGDEAHPYICEVKVPGDFFKQGKFAVQLSISRCIL